MPAVRELAVLLLVAVVGATMLPTAWSPRRRAAAAVPAGLAAVVAVELALLSTGLPIAYPVVALVVTVGVALAVAGPDGLARLGSRGAVALAGGIAVVVVVTAWWPLANVSADSFRYLMIAGLLTTGGETSGASGFLLLSRSLSIPTIHGLADPALGYMRAVGPVVGLSVVALVGDVAREGARRLDPGLGRLVALGAMMVLATNHWFVFHVMYINGHLVFAAWLLLTAVVTAEVVRGPDDHMRALAVTCVLAIAVVVVRPEGALVAGLALAPVLLERSVPRRWRGSLLAVTGLGVVLWHAAVVLPLLGPDAADRSGMLGMTALGVGLLIASLLLRVLDKFSGQRPLIWLHAGAWLALAALAAISPGIARSTAKATLRNVTSDGLWGVSFWVLAVLVAFALWSRRVPGQRVWVFPLLTFIPLGLMLAFIRGGAYRIGAGDSLNRMLMHVVPLAVLTVALAAGGAPRRDDEPLEVVIV